MKIKGIAVLLGTLLLIFTLITTTFAIPVLENITEKGQLTIKDTEKENDKNDEKPKKSEAESMFPGKARRKPELTDEMKQKIDKINAERQERIKKWNALTEAQKAEIYKLQDQIAELNKKMADKYCEFEIIDKDTAERIKKKIDKISSKIKSEGIMPVLDRGKSFKKCK